MPRRPLAVLACALALVVAAAGCTSARPKPKPTNTKTTPATATLHPTSSSGAPTVKPISFVNCTKQIQPSLAKADQNRVARLTFSCGRLDVPLDYRHPTGASTQIYVVRVHDNSQVHKTGSLIVNPGGPGASGVGLAIDLSTQVSDNLLQHFDLVGFDPRGVFLSTGLNCVSDSQKDALAGLHPDVRTTAGYNQATAVYSGIARSCSVKYGSALQYYNTTAAARDMDLVRQGVGDTKLNYLGLAYGTVLGAVYAHLFPQLVRTEVLAGAVDPAMSELATAETRVAGFEAALTQFAAACRTDAACKPLGTNPRATVLALTRALDRRPLVPKSTTDKRRVTGAYVLSAAAAALYDQGKWAALRDALVKARAGDPTGLLTLTDAQNQRDDKGHYTNLIDTNTVVSCNDLRSSLTAAQIRSTATRWAKRYPVFGLAEAAQLTQCAGWQKDRHPVPAVTATGSAPVLVIGAMHDPATPYPQATRLASELGTGVVLTWDGAGPAGYPKTKCVRDAVENYLIDQKVPTTGTSCPAK